MTENFYDKAMALQQEKTARTADMADQRQLLFRLLALKAGEDFLEVGSGNGIFVREAMPLLGATARVVGVDTSPDMVALSKAICPDATFMEGSATDLPVDDGAFDVAMMAQVLCFVDDVDGALRELYRVLKPGGRIVLLDTHWDSLVWAIPDPDLRQKIRGWIARPYVRDDIPADLSARLREAGFAVTGRHIHPVVNWSLEPDTYSAQLIEYFKPMAAEEGSDSTKQLNAWIEMLSTRSERGAYLFSLCRYVFCAEKPVS